MSTTVDLGIDLGTTNSAIAAFDNGQAHVLKGFDGHEILPSCVAYDSHATTVGEIARNALLTNPENAFEGFKRFMGTNVTWPVPALGRSILPEELSAEVLRELRSWATGWLNQQPDEAVVTIPAAFGEIEKRAVMLATESAGFSRATLIQEPIAAGLAYGWAREDTSKPFLVYDFGGGTFDAAVVRTVSGQLVILGNHGNHTEGGRDMDAEILSQMVRPLLSRRLAEDDLNLRRAKYACEEAKKRLSAPGLDNTRIGLGSFGVLFEDGSPVAEQIQVFRTDLEELVHPQVIRTTEVIRTLLEDLKLRDSDLGAIILVGGPTKMPVVRRLLQESFGTPIFTRVDPMTVVAQGAALFAASIQKSAKRVSAARTGVMQVRLEYDPVADGASVPVGITGMSGPLPVGAMVRLRRNDGLWDSGLVKVIDGTAVISAGLADDPTSSFSLELFDERGSAVAVEPADLRITKGIAAAAPPLARAIGVGVVFPSGRTSEDQFMIDIVAKRGQPTPLTARGKYVTLRSLEAGNNDEQLIVGFFEGPATTSQAVLPERCHLIGQLTIRGTDLDRPLPIGSEVDVTIRIDASRQAVGRVFIPSIQKTIESDLIEFSRRRLSTSEEMEARFGQIEARFESLEDAQVETASLRDRAEVVQDAIAAARAGNQDAVARAEARLEELELAADETEAAEAPRLALDELEGTLGFTRKLIEDFGEESHFKQLENLTGEGDRARTRNDADAARSIRDRALALAADVYWSQPGAWVQRFQELAAYDSFTDQARARDLIHRGRQALELGDVDLLRRAVLDLITLTPREERESRWSVYAGLGKRA